MLRLFIQKKNGNIKQNFECKFNRFEYGTIIAMIKELNQNNNHSNDRKRSFCSQTSKNL